MVHKLIIICLFFSGLPSVLGQDFNTVLATSMNKMKGSSFSIDLDYALCKGEKEMKKYEEYSGILSRKDNMIYQKIGAMESVHAPNFTVKLNHQDQEIRIDRNTDKTPLNYVGLDLTTINKCYDRVEMRTQISHYELELLSKESYDTQFSKVIIYIDKQSRSIIKQVMFYKQLQDFSFSETISTEKAHDVARLEIIFKNYTSEVDSTLFDQNRYFKIDNDKVILGEEFENFELVSAN